MPRESIALAAIRTSIVLGGRLLVQAGTLVIVAKLLGPAQFGAFSGVSALAVLLGTLSTCGTHLVLLGEMSKDPARCVQVLSYALPITFLCSSVLLLTFLALCIFVFPWSGMTWDVLLVVGVADIVLLPLIGLIVSEYLAVERTAYSQVLQTLPLVGRLVVAVLVFQLQLSDPLEAYCYGYCAASAIALVVGLFFMFQPWPRLWSWRWPSRQELCGALSYGVLNITAMGPTELDKTLAIKLLPLSAAGLYSAGARVVGAFTIPVVALMLSVLPRLFRIEQCQSQSGRRLLLWVFGVTTLYSGSLALALYLCAPLFVWLLGAEYVGLDEVIKLLSMAVPGMALRIAAGNVLMALGKPWVRAGFEVIGLLVLIVMAIVLTACVGENGMPLALVFSEWVMAIIGCGMILHVRG